MRRFVFALAFWLYLSLDRMLQGVGAALYFDRGWEMTFIWLVSIVFLAMVALTVWRDPSSRTRLFAPPAVPTCKEMAWYLFLLALFTCFLVNGLNATQQWWQAEWVDLWFKIVFGMVQVVFWGIAGRWWRDAIRTIVQIRRIRLSAAKGEAR